jgi:hypothetical protein
MKFCKISLIVWIDNFICWIPVFVVPVSIIKPWNLVNLEKKHMQQLEQEKFGVKVQSHDTIFFWFFFSTCFLSDISTSVGFLYPSDRLRRIVLWEQWKKLSHMRIKFKSWNVWTLDHSTYLCHRCRIIRKPDS